MIQVSQNLDALIDEIRSIAEELEEEGECDSVILTRLESVAFNLEHLANGETHERTHYAGTNNH